MVLYSPKTSTRDMFFYNPFTVKDVVLLVPYSSKTSTRDIFSLSLSFFSFSFYNPFTAKAVVLLVPYSSKTSTRDMGVFSTTPSLSKMSCWCCTLPRIVPETCFSIKAINYVDDHDDNDHDDENDDEDYYYCYMLN